MDKKYQIFVSSTFEDLQDERRAVSEQILNLGHLPVGMELFHASNEDQWSHITRRIKQCDYYVVIVAERYGSTDAEGQSFTEKEYRLALSERIPVAAFLLSDDARSTWPQSKLETSAQVEVKRFRELCKRKLIKYWSNPQDLALAVTNSLSVLFEEHPRPGLVPGTQATPTETLKALSELTEKVNRLEVENNNLRTELEGFRTGPTGSEIVQQLQSTTLNDFAKAMGYTCVEQKANEGDKDFKSTEFTKIEPKSTLWDVYCLFYLSAYPEMSARTIRRLMQHVEDADLMFSGGGDDPFPPWGLVLERFTRLNILASRVAEEKTPAYVSRWEADRFGISVIKYRISEFGKNLFQGNFSPHQLLFGQLKTNFE